MATYPKCVYNLKEYAKGWYDEEIQMDCVEVTSPTGTHVYSHRDIDQLVKAVGQDPMIGEPVTDAEYNLFSQAVINITNGVELSYVK